MKSLKAALKSSLQTYLLHKYPYLGCAQCYNIIRFFKKKSLAQDKFIEPVEFDDYMKAQMTLVETNVGIQQFTKNIAKKWIELNIAPKKPSKKFRRKFKIISGYERKLARLTRLVPVTNTDQAVST